MAVGAKCGLRTEKRIQDGLLRCIRDGLEDDVNGVLVGSELTPRREHGALGAVCRREGNDVAAAGVTPTGAGAGHAQRRPFRASIEQPVRQRRSVATITISDAPAAAGGDAATGLPSPER